MAVSGTLNGDEVDDLELELLLTAIARHYGYDFRQYARASLRRRVRRAVQAEEVATISELQGRLLRDPACMQRFLIQVSVGYSTMFRDPAFFATMTERVLPRLRTYPFVRIWHAGCAAGQEVYSMAILLTEAGIYDRCRLYATDLSHEALASGVRGVFPYASMRVNTANYLAAGGKRDFSSYYEACNEGARFDASLRRNVVFSRHNLVSDAAFNEFHLILCRNVLIYFSPPLQARVVGLLHESLGRRGILALGPRETLRLSPHNHLFSPLVAEHRLYQRAS